MYTVMRHYQGQKELAAELTKHGKEVEKAISAVPGFLAYFLVNGSDGVTTITICENRKGCEESTKIAADWLKKNLPNLRIPAPHLASGEVPLAFDRIHAHA